MNPLEASDSPLEAKIAQVLNRVAIASRADDWESWGTEGLNPTQGQVLQTLRRWGKPLRLSTLAQELAVSMPTVSDSVAVLQEKGLVRKDRASEDRRALALSLTAAGRRLVTRLDSSSDSIERALKRLDRANGETLYRLLLQLVVQLQRDGDISVARMCVTCAHFRPYVHDDAKRPHHCALVDAPFGHGSLRADCPEHEPADAATAANLRRAFTME